MRVLPWLAKKWLVLCVIIAALLGAVVDASLGTKIDYWIHDAALVFQARTEWKSTAIIVLDDDVPIQVSRKQALPLFAKAAENALAAGAKGVFLDARIPKEIEGIMPYALCIEKNGTVRWSNPGCEITSHNQCELRNSAAGHAPLAMKGSVFSHFKIAPYLADSSKLPDFLLFGVAAETYIPDTGLVASDRIIAKNSPINVGLNSATITQLFRWQCL